MPLKRKRSSPSALSPSTSTTNSTSRSSSPNPLPDIQMSDTTAPQYPSVDPSSSHLDSRTRKRFRDNRPDEDTIHAHTYATLFAAAAAAANPPTTLAAAPPAPPGPSTRPPPPPRHREGSLHDYWTIATPPPPPPPPVPASINGQPSSFFDHAMNDVANVVRCEDCDGALRPGGDAADVRMMDGVDGEYDLEQGGGEEWACRSCGRRVCDTCAVVQIGVGRDCLGCKTRRREKWVGGIGWCP